MAYVATIIQSISVAGGASVSDSTALTVPSTGSNGYSAQSIAVTTSSWTPIPTGSLTAGIHYLYLKNTATASTVDVSNTNSQGGTFTSLNYLDAVNLAPSASQGSTQGYFARVRALSQTPSSSLNIVATEN